MTSIYQRALGAQFAYLHPKMQWRFGFSADDEVAACSWGSRTCAECRAGRRVAVQTRTLAGGSWSESLR